MLTRFYRSAAYVTTDYAPDLQAYRTDRFTGWERQPAKVGPVMFSNTSPGYFNLKPMRKVSQAGLLSLPDSGGPLGGMALLLSAAGLLATARRRSHSAR